MAEKIETTEAGDRPMNGDGGRSLIDLMIIFAKRKKLIIGLPVLAAICSIIVSLLLPNIYKANTKILPPQQAQSGAAALLSQLSGVASAAAGAAGIKNPNDLYIGMLKSRTISDNLIQRFDLKNVYSDKYMEQARKDLENKTTILAGKDGLISVDVEDRDAKRAADIANAYAEELLKLTKTLAVTEASQRRLFFERQLQLTKDNLAHAEVVLDGALGNRGVISVDSASRAIVETTAKLGAQITAKEIQLNAMQPFMTANNQDFKKVQQELDSARAELSKLKNGGPALDGDPTDADKQSGLENAKILREVKYHQMLYELLAKQYEVARLDESKDSSIIQVLDKATVPERKFKPKRSVIVIISTLLALLASIFWALVSEERERALRSPETAEKLRDLERYLKFRKA